MNVPRITKIYYHTSHMMDQRGELVDTISACAVVSTRRKHCLVSEVRLHREFCRTMSGAWLTWEKWTYEMPHVSSTLRSYTARGRVCASQRMQNGRNLVLRKYRLKKHTNSTSGASVCAKTSAWVCMVDKDSSESYAYDLK